MVRCARRLLEPGGRRRKSRHALALCRRESRRLSLLVYRRDNRVFPSVQLFSRSDHSARAASGHGCGLLSSDHQLPHRQRGVGALPARAQAPALANGRRHLDVPGRCRRHAARHIVAGRDRSRADLPDSARPRLRGRCVCRRLSDRRVLAFLGAAAAFRQLAPLALRAAIAGQFPHGAALAFHQAARPQISDRPGSRLCALWTVREFSHPASHSCRSWL